MCGDVPPSAARLVALRSLQLRSRSITTRFRFSSSKSNQLLLVTYHTLHKFSPEFVHNFLSYVDSQTNKLKTGTTNLGSGDQCQNQSR